MEQERTIGFEIRATGSWLFSFASQLNAARPIMQDNGRGPIVGMRTMGAGGSVVSFTCTSYTESICRITVSLMNRGVLIQTPEYPAAPYIENIGVRSDIVLDCMTRANLISGGAPFVQAFTQIVLKQTQGP